MEGSKKKEGKQFEVIEGEIVKVKLSDPVFLQQAKSAPFKTLGELAFGIWGEGKLGTAKSFARIFRAARFGQGFEQLFKELADFQGKGNIEADVEISQNKFFTKSFVDLMEMIDSNPDEDYLKAVKALFFLLLSVDKDEEERVRIYSLMQAMKELSSSELSTLGCVYELYKQIKWQGIPGGVDHWLLAVTEKSLHKIRSFIENDEDRLIELRLITSRIGIDKSGINRENWRLTDSGVALCEYILEGETTFFS